ncbi:hypothetical protein NC653_006189 [Populus alba x Populus x berolinensis]|uniref:Uncharacterized protein n=1 Tax=Populus alba x Populus x berolinensis TaxID=444605 RepID=A0AAD6RDM1_9ROSI|nr:hypothetical protein NC653_006189 [Populus alba x Populus x berolinensis]
MKALGWWLMLVGSLRLASVWFGFFDIWALRLAVFSNTTNDGHCKLDYREHLCRPSLLCIDDTYSKLGGAKHPPKLAVGLPLCPTQFGSSTTQILPYINSVDAYSVERAPKEPSKAFMKLGCYFAFDAQVFLADLEGGFASRFQLLIWISDTACQGLQLALLVRHIINWTAVLMMFLFSALNASTMSKFLESTRKFTGFLHAVIVRIY